MAGLAMVLGTVIFYFLKDKYVIAPDGSAIRQNQIKTLNQEKFVEQAKFFQVHLLE